MAETISTKDMELAIKNGWEIVNYHSVDYGELAYARLDFNAVIDKIRIMHFQMKPQVYGDYLRLSVDSNRVRRYPILPREEGKPLEFKIVLRPSRGYAKHIRKQKAKQHGQV